MCRQDGFVDKLRGFLSQNKLKPPGGINEWQICSSWAWCRAWERTKEREQQRCFARKAALQVIASSLDDKQIQQLVRTKREVPGTDAPLLSALLFKCNSQGPSKKPSCHWTSVLSGSHELVSSCYRVVCPSSTNSEEWGWSVDCSRAQSRSLDALVHSDSVDLR